MIDRKKIKYHERNSEYQQKKLYTLTSFFFGKHFAYYCHHYLSIDQQQRQQKIKSNDELIGLVITNQFLLNRSLIKGNHGLHRRKKKQNNKIKKRGPVVNKTS